ncbi:hypothetical protein PLICRDRAFT_44675 [Plicaturopsis crispa FD-325 SS-3]|nr:hypothetical protein PLICRDRAFT_44675 [Plicaturopsis crispa FD-325 SS-3]
MGGGMNGVPVDGFMHSDMTPQAALQHQSQPPSAPPSDYPSGTRFIDVMNGPLPALAKQSRGTKRPRDESEPAPYHTTDLSSQHTGSSSQAGPQYNPASASPSNKTSGFQFVEGQTGRPIGAPPPAKKARRAQTAKQPRKGSPPTRPPPDFIECMWDCAHVYPRCRGIEYRRRNDIVNHIKQFHFRTKKNPGLPLWNDPEREHNERLECLWEGCHRSVRKDGFIKHLAGEKHADVGRRPICTLCGSHFAGGYSLDRHQETCMKKALATPPNASEEPSEDM